MVQLNWHNSWSGIIQKQNHENKKKDKKKTKIDIKMKCSKTWMEKSTKDLTKEKKKTRPLSKELCQEKKKVF